MAQLTPAEILAISEPIEAIYQRTVDELLINIAHHFNISGWERTRYWEIKKLSEMGALTKESARIIAQNTKMLPEEIEKAFLQVAEKACLDIDPQLRAAAEKGILQDPGTSPSTSVLMRDSIRSYVAQAQDTLNMVNTTMLQSTREAYMRGIATAVSEAQLQEAKEILETQALEVVTGQETRVRAIRKAMNQLTATGITGFYDKSGRKWHAESYAAMVVRSTSHNAAIQAIKTRQQEFGGGDIFQVSSHNGARPLCFPYQGKFYSWSAGHGEFEDGSGHTRRYENIDQTSYGEPAGLFGINCGHHPIPMIPGFSYPQEGPTQTKAENDKEYRESQTQRAYERQVREAKRDLEIAKATGDEEAIKDAKQKVAQEQAKIRAYVAETGRARRYDREQIPGGKDAEGYKGYRRQRNSDIPASKPKVKTKAPDFVAANTINDAKEYAQKTLGLNTSMWADMNIDVANMVNHEVLKIYSEFGNLKNGGVLDGIRILSGNQNFVAAYSPQMKEAFLLKKNVKYKTSLKKMKEKAEEQAKAGFWSSTAAEHSARHELGHAVQYMITQKYTRNNAPTGILKEIDDMRTAIMNDIGITTWSTSDTDEHMLAAGKILSYYGLKDNGEFIAESIAEYMNGSPRETAKKVIELLKKG